MLCIMGTMYATGDSPDHSFLTSTGFFTFSILNI
uniref:Uncharacterized protein n=1 Tax=Anguilla anguilla TaxID=7936 RepID=A0A0E9RYR5_ANGAN